MTGSLRASEELQELATAFANFAQECRGSSPLYELLARGIPEHPEVVSLLEEAEERQRRANLLFAAVHDLILGGTDHLLATYYPSVGGTRRPDAEALEAFVDFVRHREGELRELISTRKTQTNEVRRMALLYPAFHIISRRCGGGPLALVEVGASAGLNLFPDRYGYRYGEELLVGVDGAPVLDCQLRRGRPLPDLGGPLEVGHRVGIDLDPLDPRDPEDARWLRACIWPEHTDRLQLLEEALGVASEHPPVIYRGEALELLPEVVNAVPGDLPVCVFHSATLAYFPPGDRNRLAGILGEIASRRRLFRVFLEGPFGSFRELDEEHPMDAPDGVYFVLGVTEWADGERSDLLLARGEPHGRWIQWLVERNC